MRYVIRLESPDIQGIRVYLIFLRKAIRTVALEIRFAKHLPDSSCGNSSGAICRAPDFFTTDEYGREADSFQYYVDADGGFPILALLYLPLLKC